MNRARISRQPSTIVFVSINEVSDDVVDESSDPYAVLRAKTEHLAELLGCTEAEAERLVLDRIGN